MQKLHFVNFKCLSGEYLIMRQISWLKNKAFICLLTVLLFISSLSIMVAPASADAKRGTVVTVESLINNADQYTAWFRCATSEWKPIIRDTDACEIDNGEHMNIKVAIDDKLTGLPKKEMIYQVTAHNNNKSYICVDKGAIERGYADTVDEVVLSNSETIDDVCTTVNGKGDTHTKALFTVKEKSDGLYIVFENTGRDDWKGYKDEYPYSTGEWKVDFSKIS